MSTQVCFCFDFGYIFGGNTDDPRFDCDIEFVLRLSIEFPFLGGLSFDFSVSIDLLSSFSAHGPVMNSLEV